MKSIENKINHRQSSHCESGVVTNMLNSQGMSLSEPMVFGLSSALTFVYLPMVKVGGLPLIAYRMPPKSIISSVCKKLNVKMKSQKFSNPDDGMKALDKALSEGKLVGLQTSVYWLPYFPEDMRFQFNAHNLTVYGKNEQGDYLISDPVFEEVVTCPAEDLKRARFAKGVLAAKGLMYEMELPTSTIDMEPHIRSSINKTAKMMNGLLLPFFGNKGIRHLVKKIKTLKNKPQKDAALFLGNIVRMQEEIGTGGAGFRFMYASFLDEAATLLNDDVLFEISKFTTEIGDLWREFAMKAVLFCKNRKNISIEDVAASLEVCAEQETILRSKLLQWSK
jgi:hypothetical protein